MHMIYTMMYGAVAYLIGSIPTGFLIACSMDIYNITQHGSGTTGATNVARTTSRRYLFFVVLLLDAGKSALLLYLTPQYAWPVCIVLLMLGNTRSIFVPHFGGGKGVATLLGIMSMLSIRLTICFLCAWACALYAYRSVGIASSIALVLLLTVLNAHFSIGNGTLLVSFLSIIVWSLYMHKAHIKHILGKET